MTSPALASSTKDDLAVAYRSANGPFSVRMDQQPDLVVMSQSDYNASGLFLEDAEITSLEAGYAAMLKGDVVDARDALAATRAKHGL